MENKYSSYLTFPEERLIFAKHTSFITLLPIFAVISSLSVLLGLLSFVFYLSGMVSVFAWLSFVLSLALCALLLQIKVLTEWFFHLYIITNKKLLEIIYVPLVSYTVNDVLLEQVKCTEIDIRMNGFFREMLNIGDIAVTFDRPTHTEEFLLKDMDGARRFGSELTQVLMNSTPRTNSVQWYKRLRDHKYYIVDSLLRGKTL